MAMEWCPQAALQAYLHTLHLCKDQSNQDCSSTFGSTSCIIEPKCMEFVSALAAGKKARLMVQITSEGVTPLTVSLAVAAKQTGGRLIVCITQPLSHHHEYVEKMSKILFLENGLDGVVEFVYGIDPCLVVKQFKDIDFAVIDCKIEEHLKVLRIMNLNPNGSMVVLNNLHQSKRGGGGAFPDQVFKQKKGYESVTLPIGEGMELTRFRSNGKYQSKRCKRFHVTYED
ncbi:putative S-adenosyl-L-methionine-dependent methyltransferase [Rosa chinensis]|uniref:Putative S-adenosyl-L-methionine-dependent methyltransferase n=1 Tax=Rosa chinensis TaxID=74649 RepID=A0A2P6PKR6_ROSCH|nr:uncharacterized protein LOC112172008 [Rosa chinensis]PRQ22527.1 putative S-adenosyl-L-methionine-dependent methyltransferase [Rosa chinensis]